MTRTAATPDAGTGAFMTDVQTLGIIAGGGQFPLLIAREAAARGMRVVICGIKGSADPALESECAVFRLMPVGQFNAIVRFLKDAGVTDLCMAGSLSKPRLMDFKPDLRAAKVIFSLKSKGDSSLLGVVVSELEKDGFRVQAANRLLPSLAAPAGVLTRPPVSDAVRSSVKYGWPIARSMGAYDIGQCIVVKENMVIAVECLEGTDKTLRRGAELGGKGCVAIKLVKPGQDERVDLPAVGLNTIKTLAECGYSALAIEASKTLFFDSEEALRLAESSGIAVIAVSEAAGGPEF